ncbi:hypothetical protein [uncultured Thiocystis sp.]|jgi:hypothetical protein|uniref:hypothetical protein n=1 Tax=uncultured Thiocystis sp. TaxID=1202134 RepID=UPI0025F0419E|nr:hypothetical protein [uncultured Thiocystis sp.]
MNTRQRPTIEGEEIAIVLIGDFNPMIFQPAWFALEGLIRRSEAEEADIEIMHHDIASFRLDWVSVDVLADRFSAKIRSSAFRVSLRDLIVGTFSTLRHTPTKQLGINLTQRWRFATDAEWHNFGHYLAPKSPWNELLVQPGMRGIHVQGSRPDDMLGHVLVSAEPDRSGFVSLRVNDHFELPKDAETGGTAATMYFVEKIESDFDASLQRAEQLIEGLITGFLSQEHFDDGTHKRR